ncbi:MAG: nucleoside 2-deoxyribosyltransferase [Kiritimatiellales bacterium]
MIYIAAPFFNSKQLAIVEGVEKILDKLSIPYYSPRKAGVLSPDSNDADRNAVYQSNVNALRSYATMVLACTAFPLPDKVDLALVAKIADDDYRITPVNLPDTGTVYEIGFAVSRGIPVIGYHHCIGDHTNESLNVMLTEAFEGFVFSRFQLLDLLKVLYVECAGCEVARARGLLLKWKGQVR